MKGISLLLFLVLLISCNSNDRQDNAGPQTVTDPATNENHIDTVTKDLHPDSSANVQRGNSIPISFAQGSSSITVDGHLDSAGASVVCYLPVAGGQKLKAAIEPRKNGANIRFNQIILPDKKADGPFGQQLEYNLTQKGRYQIIIGPSLMAENPYTGAFRLHLEVK